MFDQGSGDINYSPGGYSGDDYNQSGSPPADMGKFIKLGAAIIIVLIIAFIAYTIISSQQTVRIILVDPNGDDVAGTLTLRDGSQKLVSISPLGKSSSFNATLWPGTYSATAKADKYKATSESITIPSPTPTISINLIRDLTATMSASMEGGETSIYEGQVLSGQIQINNTGNTFNVNDIVFTGEEPLTAEIVTANLGDIPMGSAPIIDFNLMVKSTAKLAGKQKQAKFSFKIKGSTIKTTDITMQVLPAVLETKVTITGQTGIVNTNLSAGTQVTIPLKINNTDTVIPLKDVTVKITPTAGSEKFLSWLTFNQATGTNKALVTFDTITPKGGEDLTLFVEPPITAKIGDEFTGILSIESPSINGSIEKTVQFKVKTEKNVTVIFSGTSTYTMKCHTTGGTCDEKNSLTESFLENSGNVEITNIQLSLNLNKTTEDVVKCQQWFTVNTTTIDSLKPKSAGGTKEPISLRIKPLYQEGYPPTQTVGCYLQWRYVNPISNQTITDEQPITLIITTQAS